MSAAGTSSPAAAVPGVTEKERFEAELEFVQALANPEYLHHLAQNRYLDDPDFLAFLEYLQYWREPRYCKYLQFPHCLRMLELLDNEAFRTALKRAASAIVASSEGSEAADALGISPAGPAASCEANASESCASLESRRPTVGMTGSEPSSSMFTRSSGMPT